MTPALRERMVRFAIEQGRDGVPAPEIRQRLRKKWPDCMSPAVENGILVDAAYTVLVQAGAMHVEPDA